MNYLILFGIVVAAGCALTLMSNSFGYAMSRLVEAGFDFVEYRLALRQREQREMRRDAQAIIQMQRASQGVSTVVMPLARRDLQAANKRSTQQLDIARVAA